MKAKVSLTEKRPTVPHTKNIFLTGATGVLGAHLLKDLLRHSKSHLFCLVRGHDLPTGSKRLLDFLKIYDPELSLEPEFHARVTPILGDVSKKNFGLSVKAYQELSEKIDLTIHAAACTNLFASLAKLRPINLGGAENIIEFCLSTKQKILSYISTYTVIGDKTFDSKVNFNESHLDIGQGFNHMAYQQSKFLAEKMIRAARERGLWFNIMRPGQIYGESQHGHYPQGQTNVGGLFYDIFKTITETRVAFKCKTYFDIVPVDYVSRAIVYLTLQRNSFFETYHLTNPDQKTYFEVVSIIRDLGYPIKFVTIPEYKELLMKKKLARHGKEYKSATTMAFKYWFRYPQFDYQESAKTDCSYTRGILEAAKIKCPKIDHHLLRTYFIQGIRQNYFYSPDELKNLENPTVASSKIFNEFAFE